MIVDVQVKAGDYMQVCMWNERPGAKGRRVRKIGEAEEGTPLSSEAQKKLNRKRSERKLRQMIHANFGKRDYAVRLDWRRFTAEYGRNPTMEEAARELRNYIRRLRRLYQKAGVALRWLYVTEVGEKSGVVHHHLLLSGGIGRDVLEEQWRVGYGNTRRLQFCETGINGLLHYIIKEPVTPRRWSASRNLVKPVPDRAVGRIRVKDAKYIDAHGDDLRYVDRLFPGYRAVEVESTPYAAGAFGMFVSIWLYRIGTDLF